MDLSKVSTEDLKAFQSGDLTKVSTEGLRAMSAPDARGTKIDNYLTETDKILKLTPGTSARQINQESRFDDAAVSPAGARGLAQVMPGTLASLSQRLGRRLDPHNTDDALVMHRELMRENLGKFGNQDDALRAYNSGWDKTKWNNPETSNYVATVSAQAPAATPAGAPPAILGQPAAKAAFVPFAEVRKEIDPATLDKDQDWLRASRQMYSLRERSSFTGSDAELADYGKSLLGNFNSNVLDMTRYAHDVVTNGTPEDKQAFLYMMDSYDNTTYSWEGARRAGWGMVTDPTNLIGVGTLGIGTAGKIAASTAAKAGLKKLLMTSLGRTGIVAGIDGSILGGATNAIRQGVEVDAGRKDSVGLGELALHTGGGALGGVVLGTLGDAAVTSITNVVRRGLGNRATRKAEEAAAKVVPGEGAISTPEAAVGASKGLPEAEPGSPLVAKAEAQAAAPESVVQAAAPESVVQAAANEGKLTEAEIKAATSRKQEGRQWVDDLPPVTAANETAHAKLTLPESNTGLRGTPRTMAQLTDDGAKIAEQLRVLDDKTMHGVLESFRQGALSLEDSQVIARGVQIHADELRVEQASLIKQLSAATTEASAKSADEVAALVERLAAVEARMVPLSLADDAFGSIAGSMLRQRQEGLPGLQGVTVESLMKDKGLTKEGAEAAYVKLVEGSKLTAAGQKIAQEYDAKIQAAIANGDTAETARLAVMKRRELDGIADLELPGSATFMQKVNEAVISNVFSLTTLMINAVPAGVKTLVLPFVKALVNDPLQRATRTELAASYSAMVSTVGGAWRAAAASFKYEQSLLTRDSGRLMEGELAIEGRKGGLIRFFPRLLNATDEFLAQLNYNSFVAGKAAAEAVVDGVSKGLKGETLDKFVSLAAKIAMEKAYTQPTGEALIQPLVNKGVNLGLTGEALYKFVEREALKDPSALRHGSDEEAVQFVRDVLFKRRFSGEGAASSLAQSYETAMNRIPSMKLVLGQLFFRTPIRVFEEGIRLTPGIQFLAPGFITDLAGKNGQLRQIRAQGEALTSLAVAGSVFTLFAQGRITGDGAHDNWKQDRTATDGPGQPPYSIKMPDGSTWSYRSFDPISTPFKIMVNGLERMDKLAIRQAQGEMIGKSQWDQALAYITTGTMAVGSALRDANLAAGVSNAIKLGENLNDPEHKDGAWLKFMGEKLSWMVPNTFHKLAKMNDPTLKDPADFWQMVETRLAALHIDREDIKTSYSYDVLGNVRQIADTGVLHNIFSTATPEEQAKGMSEEGQKVMIELNRLQMETGAIFSPPIKHEMTGGFDLRTTLTADKSETLYDRWQRNYRDLKPDTILYPIVTAEMPDGTRKSKGVRREMVEGVIKDLRDAAFMQTVAQEQRVIDEVIKLEVGNAKSKAGLNDWANRDK